MTSFISSGWMRITDDENYPKVVRELGWPGGG
jgi:hypothetical protein